MTKDDLLKKLFKEGDLIVCVEKTSVTKKRIKNIFKFHDYINGDIAANGHNVIASMRNEYISVLFSFKDASNIDRCCDIRLATEREKALYEEVLRLNHLNK